MQQNTVKSKQLHLFRLYSAEEMFEKQTWTIKQQSFFLWLRAETVCVCVEN